MDTILKYILLLFLISFMICKLCFSDRIENFTSYQSYYQTVNPELAGSITIKQNYDNNNLSELLATQLLKYNETIQNPELAGSIEIDTSLINPSFNMNKYQKLIVHKSNDNNIDNTKYSIEPSDYQRYETILPEKFQPPNIKYRDQRKEILDTFKEDRKFTDTKIDVELKTKIGTKINPENNCKGEWSNWNNEHCGDIQNRCGMKYKTYSISEVEKSDETGDGLPCPYKDGEIVYQYCQGENNIERCGYSDNFCECELDENNSENINGEATFKLINDNCNFKQNLDCNCPQGFKTNTIFNDDICELIPGEDCSLNESGCIYTSFRSESCSSSTGNNTHCRLNNGTCEETSNAPSDTVCTYIPSIEESCLIPEFLTNELEMNFYQKYSDKNGKCEQLNCVCENGKNISPQKCGENSLSDCEIVPCDNGYILEGNPPRCVEKTNNKCSCPYGIGKENYECSRSSDKISCVEDSCDTDMTDFIDTDGYGPPENNRPLRIETDSLGNETQYGNIYYKEDEEFLIPIGDYCMPRNQQCLFNDIDRYNIKSKQNNSRFRELNSMYLGELIDFANSLEISEEIINEKLNTQYPKYELINEIIKNEDPNNYEGLCITSGNVSDCSYSFECKENYSFVPNDYYRNEQELRLLRCNDNNPVFNGTCLPVSCPVTDDIKSKYDISFNSCSSTSENCNLNNVECKNEDYVIPGTIPSINCIAPFVIDTDDINNVELTVSGCDIQPSESGATSGSR